MKLINKEDLQKLVSDLRKETNKGKVTDRIPELSKVNSHALGVTIAPIRSETISVGDCDHCFTLQSISKVISLLVALMDWGPEYVFYRVGMEPSGDPYSSMVKLETQNNHKPLNPMINAGAIVIASMIKGANVNERFRRVCDLLQQITGNKQINLNERVYLSEKRIGDRSRALAYFMKSTKVIEGDVNETLDLYFRLCSINVTCLDLAKMGHCFANGGYLAGEKAPLFCTEILQILLAVMMTSGMYNASGEFATKVGFPGKSGVSGGMMAVIPDQMGIGIFGPAIDEKGNSTAGWLVLEHLSKQYHLHLFSRKKEF